MRIGRWALATAFGVGFWGSALAADLDAATCQVSEQEQKELGCVCVGPLVAQTSHVVAMLDQIQGKVLKSAAAGYSPVTEPTPLDVGDSVLVKDHSNALLTVGMDCHREIGPNASLVIRQTERGCACAALLEEKPKIPLLHMALIAGGIGTAILLIPDPVSP